MGGVPLKSRVALTLADRAGPSFRWIKTMRQARGLSLRQLGVKLGIQGNSVHVAERREATGGISIYQLQRIAGALDCDLFYAFVPRQRSAGLAARHPMQSRAPTSNEAAAPLSVEMGGDAAAV